MLFFELNLSVCAWCDFFNIIIILLFDHTKQLIKLAVISKYPWLTFLMFSFT